MNVTSTLGWGCPCPRFVIESVVASAEDVVLDRDPTEANQTFLELLPANEVSNINEFWFTGTYRVTGHYTGALASVADHDAGNRSRPRRPGTRD